MQVDPMHWRLSIFTLLLSSLAAFSASFGVVAQEPPSAPPPRPLAPGVLTVIPSESAERETFSGPLTLFDIAPGMPKLDFSPNYTPKSDTSYERAKHVILRREIWNLEFAFKPLRMTYVDVPQPTGKMQRKLIWYMVYRVKYLGSDLNPTAKEDAFKHITFTPEPVNYPHRRFFPHFVLEGKVLEADTYINKAYLDRIVPVALGPILYREDPRVKLHNSVEMTRVPVPLSDDRIDRSVWGIVTWEDVDPRIDFLSIYIEGLTNAFEFNLAADGTKSYKYKTLQLNFWRPGDTVDEHEREIRYGLPLYTDVVKQKNTLDHYNLTEPLDHLWIYR
jgi:hypothetical protein